MNDNDVLTLLRAKANEDAPSLTLQADDVMRSGRRRQLRQRALGVGGGVVVAAAAVALAVAVAGSEPSATPVPADRTAPTTEPIPGYLPHAMPAILKEAALPPFKVLPDWAEFRIDAFDYRRDAKDRRTPLSEAQWGQATTWALGGTVGRRTIGLSVGSVVKAGLGNCEVLAQIDARECQTEGLPDGRKLTTYWTAVPDQGYWRFVAVVTDDDALQQVGASASAWAPTLEDASSRLLLSKAKLVEMASNPILHLPGAMQPLTPEGS